MSDMQDIVFIMAAVLLLGIFWLILFLFIKSRMLAAKHKRIEITGNSARVPLVAAFSGWKGVPWICWSSSNLKPSLILHPDAIEYRVIKTRRKSYDAVSRVDYRQSIGTTNIILEFSDSLSSFVGNTANKNLARDVIEQLAQKGCPLSPRAERLLAA